MNKPTLPSPDEYAEFYAVYIERAQARGDVAAALAQQIDEIESAL